MLPLQTFRSHFSRRCVSQTIASRAYASQTPGNPMLEVFNRKVKHLQKDRAAQNVEESRNVDYLKDEVATRLCERLLVSSCSPEGREAVTAWSFKQLADQSFFNDDRISSATSPTSLTSAQTVATLPKLSQTPVSMWSDLREMSCDHYQGRSRN